MKFCAVLLCLLLCTAPFVYSAIMAQSETYVLAYPNDCTKFQQCDLSGCFVMSCGRGTEFNPAIHACDYPLRDRTDCSNRRSH